MQNFKHNKKRKRKFQKICEKSMIIIKEIILALVIELEKYLKSWLCIGKLMYALYFSFIYNIKDVTAF